ncbi:MAG: hypothetical protein AUJ70_05370 [Candidatus Omnitrophica bacterium CG1_02_40_15]|nr:MAG: hypothetical protein AUJ70_05370 [Candidatus Omnitrophica bacterium CG1_02_40_15]
MKKQYILILSLVISICCVTTKYGFGATVGNALDLDLPQRSAVLRQEIVKDTLDEYEQAVKIKGSFDIEFVFDKDLHVNPDLNGAKIEGQWYMAKFGITILNRVEPYIKIGTSNLETKWKHNSQEIEVDADNGFAWGGGLKANIVEFLDGIRLTGDLQYRTTEPDAKGITVNGTSVSDKGAKFKVDEWQMSLLLSKKFEIPLKLQSIYIVPYTGLTYADSNVDVSFINPGMPGTDFSLFDANNKKLYGFVLGCDIVPSLSSSFIYSIELRLVDEVSLSLGAAMKF